MLSDATPPEGVRTPAHFLAVRLEALYQLGRFEDVEVLALRVPDGQARDPVIAMILTEVRLGQGRIKEACEDSNRLIKAARGLPEVFKVQAFVMAAYCDAVEKDFKGAMLKVALARDKGLDAPYHFAVLEALADGARVRARPPTRMGMLDYAYHRLAGGRVSPTLIERAPPPLAMAMAHDVNLGWPARLAAAERAAALGALSPRRLGDLYTKAPARRSSLAATSTRPPRTALERAALFQALLRMTGVREKARAIRALMEAAKRAGLVYAIGPALAPLVRALRPERAATAFAESAIEVLMTAGDNDRALGWALVGSGGRASGRGRGGGPLTHWLALLDIAEGSPGLARGAGFPFLQNLVAEGRLGPLLLQRLVTVLDALRYNVPIPIWQKAGDVSQAGGGHLPKTGVLGRLKAAAERGHVGETVLLAIDALGPKGPRDTHVLALGDVIRALAAVGLEREARRLAFEALFFGWPRREGS